MATKPTTKKELESNEFDMDTITMEETVVPKETKLKPLKDTWVIKDRTYIIADSHFPLTYTIQGKHSARYPLIWFNKETGDQEELRYATNQNSPLVSQQKGQATLGHIIFENGILTFIPDNKESRWKTSSTEIKDLLSRYFVGLIFQILIIFIIYTIGLLIIGVENLHCRVDLIDFTNCRYNIRRLYGYDIISAEM